MLIYDIEIEKAILGKNEVKIDDVEYCNGWQDYAGMGISVICAYDYREDRYRSFLRDNFSEFQALVDNRNTIVGFNNISFDNRVCAAESLIVQKDKSYDILVEIWKACGLGETFKFPQCMGYGLDDCVKVNFSGIGKTGHGALAPVQWQRGEIGTVVDYCLADVWLTKKLLDLIIEKGEIVNPKSGKLIAINKPLGGMT